MARIDLDGVAKRYGRTTAVAGIDLGIRHRECLVLLGPSGSGKTTLLRLIAGLDRPSAGHIRIAGEPVTARAGAARDIAMVPQPVGLYPHLTVAENIAFPLRGAGLAKPLRAQMVQAIAARFGLEADLGQLPRSLSGGQQQRVALARALVRDPALVVMDDPLCHLDARLRSRTRRDLRALTRERGTTTLVATHDPAEALALGDRIAVLQGGRLQQLAPPQEVYDRPANAFVAGFVGRLPMNLLSGDISGGVFRGHRCRSRGLAAPDGPVTLGFRAEDAQLLEEDIGFTGCELTAPLEDLEPLGDSVLLWLRHGDGLLVARADKGYRAAIGSRLRIIVPPDICHLFDARSGQRLGGAEGPDAAMRRLA